MRVRGVDWCFAPRFSGSTGRVTGLSPRAGSADGGDTLTISGENLGYDRYVATFSDSDSAFLTWGPALAPPCVATDPFNRPMGHSRTMDVSKNNRRNKRGWTQQANSRAFR